MGATNTRDDKSGVDPFMTAIIANRIDGIIREMTNTLLRAARSPVISGARDFSCSICTADNQLLASAEGLPVHIFGSHVQAKTMMEYHGDDLREGDCFLHNDVYSGNTHAADHTFLVPVFVDGEHMFTVVAKAHQADIGNAAPSTYMPLAKDVYEEGALIFPAVRVQRGFQTIDDIVRMCKRRIRVPDQWYGDFLAGVGAVRIGERRLKELCTKYGKEQIETFIRDWFDYSEQRMIQVIRKLPRRTLEAHGAHDRVAGVLPEGVPLKLRLEFEPEEGRIVADLRDNVDNMPCGLNLSVACATAAVLAGVFNAIGADVPRNSGSFRRLSVQLREGSVLNPRFPHSCSIATTNLSDRLINMTQAAISVIQDGYGLAEGGIGLGAGVAAVAGEDFRADGAPYVSQLIVCAGGGPGGPVADGWPTYIMPAAAGLLYRESVEIAELKLPLEFRHIKLLPGTGGAGRHRGSPAIEIAYGPKERPMNVLWMCDGTENPPKGVRGGHAGIRARHWKVSADGREEELPNITIAVLHKGELVRGYSTSGGGYGDPLDRSSNLVLQDVLEGYESESRAHDVYGVLFNGSREADSLSVDVSGTARHRKALRAAAE
jgi:N-methylhydantoinase B